MLDTPAWEGSGRGCDLAIPIGHTRATHAATRRGRLVILHHRIVVADADCGRQQIDRHPRFAVVIVAARPDDPLAALRALIAAFRRPLGCPLRRALDSLRPLGALGAVTTWRLLLLLLRLIVARITRTLGAIVVAVEALAAVAPTLALDWAIVPLGTRPDGLALAIVAIAIVVAPIAVVIHAIIVAAVAVAPVVIHAIAVVISAIVIPAVIPITVARVTVVAVLAFSVAVIAVVVEVVFVLVVTAAARALLLVA